MSGARPWTHRLALAAFVLLAGRPAIAGVSGFRLPLVGERLEPSSVVKISWTLDNWTPGDEECELVLSLDGGRTFPVRVTANLDPETRRVSWRVPALATDNARLALRTGSDGEPGQETLRLISEPFAIVPAPQAPVEDLFAGRSEWLTREAAASQGAPRHAMGLHDQASEGIHSGPVREDAAELGTSSALLSRPVAVATAPARPLPPLRTDGPILRPSTCQSPLRE